MKTILLTVILLLATFTLCFVAVAMLVGLSSQPCHADSVVVELSTVSADGFVVTPLDMTPAANWLKPDPFDIFAFFYGDKRIEASFHPGADDMPLRGTFIAMLPDDIPKGKPCRLRLELHRGFPVDEKAQRQFIAHHLTFDVTKHGGLPSAVTFPNGKTLETLKWYDRLHDPQTGSWNMSDAVIDGTTGEQPSFIANNVSSFYEQFPKSISVTAAFKQGDRVPSSKPMARYRWFTFPKKELVYVIATAQQDEPTEWQEKHFLELHIPDGSFPHWFGDDKSGTFTGTKQSQTFNRFAGFHDDAGNVIAAIAPGTVIYDGLNEFGPYLLPKGNNAWQPWTETRHRTSTWYWIGNSDEPAKALQAAYETIANMPRAEIVIPELATATDWKTVALNDLFLSGKIASKEELLRLRETKELPEGWLAFTDDTDDDDLALILEITNNGEKGKGVQLLSLIDKKTNTILSARESVPLLTAEVRDKETGKTFTLTSDDGWGKIDRHGSCFFLSNPIGLSGAEGMQVLVRLHYGNPEYPPQNNGFHWRGSLFRSVDRYEIRNVSCGQIALRNLGPTMKAFYPHVSGVVTENPVGKELRWRGTYPSGWCSMQYMAVYEESKNVGLYVAASDRGGAVKDIRLDSVPDSLTIRFEQPLPLPQSSEVSSVVWRVFQGDWYDAAVIYRDEVRKNAQWYPRREIGPEGRTDTPQWMKELSVWALCSDPPEKMPATMRKFTDALGIPTAVHWYNWHQIPFDNDYPHYFPAKEGFKEAVAEIQKKGDCFVMPYINGRLWDTRDKGAEDFQFTSVALPGATKKEDGTPYIETYGSKESDGSKVELAVMCPASEVWRNKVTENIFRLIDEYDVAGVYVDQVAAAQPVLCFDASHGHPLAGGDWWNREHWKLYEEIRAKLPEGKMLTTECNADPFVNIFDGYLTWHFQYQGQVPAFAAVYGGAVQMFGRAYRGGSSQVLADRMKLAEQLVYGEQIGWIDPRIVDDPVRFPFFKEIVQVRHKFRDYFYKGEMIRPPKLLDDIPTVTADWQWSGETILTADAVQTGAWRKKDESGNSVSDVFFFVNVSDKPITSHVKVQTDLLTDAFDAPLTFEPGVPLAVEVVR